MFIIDSSLMIICRQHNSDLYSGLPHLLLSYNLGLMELHPALSRNLASMYAQTLGGCGLWVVHQIMDYNNALLISLLSPPIFFFAAGVSTTGGVISQGAECASWGL